MSVAPENMEPKNTGTRWTQRNFGLDISALQENDWGISQEYFSAMVPWLHLEESYPSNLHSPATIHFTFEHLKLLAKFLNEQGVYETTIIGGIQKFLDGQSVKRPGPPVDDDTNYDKAIQIALHRFMSPNSPFSLTVDGRWGPQTQRAVDYVAQTYRLNQQTPSRVLLNKLELIASRIIRLACKNGKLIEAIGHNPFCLIDAAAAEFELMNEEADGCIRRMADATRLVNFPGLLSKESKGAAVDRFSRFAPWFMLLQLNAGSYSGYGELSLYKNKLVGWAPIRDFKNEQAEPAFLVQPDYCLDINDEPGGQQGNILFKTNPRKPVELLCCAFLEDFTYWFIPVTQTRSIEGGMETMFDLTELYQSTGDHFLQGSLPGGKANFLKIFLVSTVVKNSLSLPDAGTQGPSPGFFAMIAAGEQELFATVTIGLNFIVAQNKTAPRNFRESVEAIYREQKTFAPDDLQKRRWGGLSTNNGHELKAAVTRKLPGFYNVTITVDIAPGSKLSGNEVAFFLHDSFDKEIQYEPIIKGKAQIKEMAYEAFTVGAYLPDGTMLELDLNEVKGYPNNFYYSEVEEGFKKTVESLYQSTRVLIENDPQKNRWGGKPIARGKVFSAEVKPTLLPGNYKVLLRVTSENSSRPLTGDVAFFLHDSFSPVIRYKKARDGEASITVNAYEDFTAGAYTQDGTLLELDLHHVKGFPEGFYYRSGKDDEEGSMQSNA